MFVFTNLLTTSREEKFHYHLVELQQGQILKNMVTALKMTEPSLILEVL